MPGARASSFRETRNPCRCTQGVSREEKQHQRCEVAAQALAEFEASKTLVRAREAVRYDPSPATLKAMKEAEQGWRRAIDKIAERAGLTKAPVMRR